MAKQQPNPGALTGDGLLNGPGEDLGPRLTPEQVAKYRDRMREWKDPRVRVCRFLYRGRGLNIQTGELSSRGCNVIYQRCYWHWDEETALEIAKDLGKEVKVVWSGE